MRESAYLRVFALVQAFAQLVLLVTRRQSGLDFGAVLVENRNLVNLQLQNGNKIGSGDDKLKSRPQLDETRTGNQHVLKMPNSCTRS